MQHAVRLHFKRPKHELYASNTAAQTQLTAAQANAGYGFAMISGKLRISAAGTIIPSVSLTVAAAAVVAADSYFRIWPVGFNTPSPTSAPGRNLVS